MDLNFPLVSVGIPLFNGSKYLVETLESIAHQTYPNLEVIIVDDNSNDESFEICNAWVNENNPGYQLFRHVVNKGLPATCNTILSLATGAFIQFVDQDDILLPQKIATDVAMLSKTSKDTAFVYSKIVLIDEKGAIIKEDYLDRIGFEGLTSEPVFSQIVSRNFIPAPSVLARRECVLSVGGYDESLLFQDWDMWLLLTRKYKIVSHDGANVYYRIHSTSMMANKNLKQAILRNEAHIKMLKKHMGYDDTFDMALKQKLKELSVYSYFMGDKNASKKLRHYLHYSLDLKIVLYLVLSLLGVPHPGRKVRQTRVMPNCL